MLHDFHCQVAQTDGQAKTGRSLSEASSVAFVDGCKELERSCESGMLGVMYTLTDLHKLTPIYLHVDDVEDQGNEANAEECSNDEVIRIFIIWLQFRQS